MLQNKASKTSRIPTNSRKACLHGSGPGVGGSIPLSPTNVSKQLTEISVASPVHVAPVLHPAHALLRGIEQPPGETCALPAPRN